MLPAKTSAETHSDGQDRLTLIDDSNLDQRPSDGASTRESQVAPVVADVAAQTHIVTSLKRSAPATPRRFRDLLALDDFERYGQRLLPPMIHLYVGGAVETGASLRRAKAAYEGLALLPRMLRDVSGRNQETELFGKTYASPFGIAPMGGAAFVAYRGDLVLAAAARLANVPMILSASSLIKLEDVHAQNQDIWFQAYLAGDQSRIDRLVDRVAVAGFCTLVVTADTPILGNREHNIRSGFSMPIRITPKVAWQSATHPRWLLGVVAQTFLRHGAPHFENMEAERGPAMMSQQSVRNTTARDKLSWAHLEAIRRRWKGNLLVKGLLAPADVQLARECGADGVVLSNHGGRQLDQTVAPLAVLPEIAAAKGAMKIVIDSGIRRGTDVIKAMALGADFVLLGRPFLYAAALGGSDGVKHAIRLLQDEIDRDMALVGVRRLNELGPDLVRAA
jgi:L-lactate dehydrogenase (cytochrome)